MLDGRTDERRWLDARLGGLSEGGCFAAVVRGEAGVGKTALIAAAVDGLAGARVLHTRGYEADADIPFAGLLELVAPLLERRDELPVAQRDALATAFALAPPSAHDRFAVPAGLLGLIGLAATDGPLLVVVDDVQWLDDASYDAIRFVARRLAIPGAGILLAVRDGAGTELDLAGLDELVLDGLDDESATRLVRRRWPQLPTATVAALVAATAGNPLALLEIPSALTAAQRDGDEPPADPLPTTAAVERAFAQQLALMPATTRQALVLAAAASRGGVGELAAGLRELGLPADALQVAERAGIFSVIDGRLTFRHPLLRAVAYRAATDAQRRAAHAAHARAGTDVRRRAWHLATAATGVDDEVAAELEQAALDARARGGHAEAARAFTRSAELSSTPSSRGRRMLEAAQDAAVTGATSTAITLLDAAAPLLDGALAPDAERLRGNLLVRAGDPLAGRRILRQLAGEAMATGDHGNAATLWLETAVASTMTGEPDAIDFALAHARRCADTIGGPAVFVARTMIAVSDVMTGDHAAGDAELAELEPQLGRLRLVGLAEPVGLLAQASMATGALDRAERAVGLLIAQHRDASALGGLPYPLAVRALLHQRRGRWTEAAADAQEAVRLAHETGQSTLSGFCLATQARIAGACGATDDAIGQGREALAIVDGAQATNLGIYALAAIGHAALAADRLDEAADALDEAAARRRRLGWREPGMALDAADHAETLLRLGRADDAAAALAELTEQARRSGGAWAPAAVRRIALMQADGDHIDHHADAALGWHARAGLPFEQARTELAWGMRLRRGRQRTGAREPLTRAYEAFAALGAQPWARRAARELEAAGAPVPGAGLAADPPGGHRAVLTPHELKVAQLVAHGMTNREVAAALFLSAKTIEHHLSVIYRRLGVRSRTELTRLFAQERPEPS